MEQETTDTSKQCNEASCKKVIEYAEEAYRLSERDEYKLLYEDGNFLELANPDEPHTSKMIAAMLNYKQNGDLILFKSFVRRFLIPMGFEEEWIKNPDIWPEKDCMDIRVLDDKYVILFESKLKGAGFQRNQLARYIYKLNDKQENGKEYNEKSIFIVLIPGHISDDFISEIPESVWRRPQDCANPICATNNKTNCWCDAEKTIEKCKDAQCDKCTEYLQSYLPHTIAIDEQFAEWILSAVGLVESRQTLLISSMTLFADYIKKLYNINYPNKLIMEIKNYLEKAIFKDGLSAGDKLEIAEQKLSNVDAVQEAFKSLIAELKVDAWYDILIKDCPKVRKDITGVYFPVKVTINEKEEHVEIGCWNGIGNEVYGNPSRKQYWAIHCVNANRKEQDPSPDLSQVFQKILEDNNIEGGKSGRYWIKWDEWNNKEPKKGVDNCRKFYETIEKSKYPIIIKSSNENEADLSVSMSIVEGKQED